jgi:ribonuclease D
MRVATSSQASNWSRRPLDADQLSYAALDAEVLLELHERFNTLRAVTTDAARGN